jgi:hypothetical protein
MSSDNEWIEWAGGAMPVDGNDTVEVRYRAPPRNDQVAVNEMLASFFNWSHDGENDDIIAYRIVRP